MSRAAITLLLALPACAASYARPVPVGRSAAALSKLSLTVVLDRSTIYDKSECAPVASAHALRVHQALERALAREGIEIVSSGGALTGRVRSLFETCAETAERFQSETEVKIEGPSGAVIVAQGAVNASSFDDAISHLMSQLIDGGELVSYARIGPKPVEKQVDLREGTYVAVFDIADSTKSLPPAVMKKMTEYLVERIAAGGVFRVVPRVPVKPQPIAQFALSTKAERDGVSCTLSSTMKSLKPGILDRTGFARVDCAAPGLLTGIEMIADQLIKP